MRRRAAVAVTAVVTGVTLAGCSDDDSGSTEAFCTTVREDTTVGTVFAGGFDPTDVTRALEQLGAARITLGALRDAAPGEVRDDITTELEYVDALVDTLEAADERQPEAIVAAVQQVTTERADEVTAAAEALATFAREECGA